MTQSVVQSGVNNFGGTSATSTVTLTATTAGNAIEIRYGVDTAPTGATVADGVNTYLLAKQQIDSSNQACAGIRYAENIAGGTVTVTVTHSGSSGNRWGWIWVAEISGRLSSGSLDSAASGGAFALTSDSPAVTGAGSTTTANVMLSAALSVYLNLANVGIDPISGNSLSWTNRYLNQDWTVEAAVSFDDSQTTTTLTPSVNWGTLVGNANSWSAVVVAFKSATGATGTLLGQCCL